MVLFACDIFKTVCQKISIIDIWRTSLNQLSLKSVVIVENFQTNYSNCVISIFFIGQRVILQNQKKFAFQMSVFCKTISVWYEIK